MYALFEQIAPRYGNRPGGYTRITRPARARVTPLRWRHRVVEELRSPLRRRPRRRRPQGRRAQNRSRRSPARTRPRVVGRSGVVGSSGRVHAGPGLEPRRRFRWTRAPGSRPRPEAKTPTPRITRCSEPGTPSGVPGSLSSPVRLRGSTDGMWSGFGSTSRTTGDSGWAAQPSRRTVSRVLVEALGRLVGADPRSG